MLILNAESTNKLNCMNYQVDTATNSFYLLDGIESLEKFSKQFGISLDRLCTELLDAGQVVLDDGTSITMV